MIKQVTKTRIKSTLLILLAFLIAFIIRINLVIPLFLVSLSFYARFRKQHIKDYNLLNMSLLFLITFVSSYYIIEKGIPFFYIPFAVIPMLSILLFNNLEISLLLTLAISFSLASLTSMPFEVGLLSFISGAFSIILAQGSRRRNTVIRTGLIVGIVQAVTLFFIYRMWLVPSDRYLILLLNGIISSIIVLGVLPLFEYLFRTTTNISLLELADFNHPLLHRMIMEAPGTYHHSLVVGNLSETACDAVGANALLARIGAYYHDIGKLQKPEYFSENQNAKESRHDVLSPNISKMIIMNHVKEGVELGKKYKLNPAIIDFIMQHHGDSLVYYFYRKALETLEEDQQVKEEGFRYPGPKPDTKETAIVLLADSVEAASRALKETTPKKIEELVYKVINNKFIDGQLDECDLTLRDLEKISSVFIKILGGIYHSRASYQEDARSEDNHKKLSKEDTHQSGKDKKDNS